MVARFPLAPGAIVAGREPFTRRDWNAVAAILVVGVVLRSIGLAHGLWFDEIQTLVEYVRRPLAQIVTTFDSQNQHYLYSILARISVVLFGESTWALRLPAMIFGVASLAATVWFGALVTARREALLAGALLAVSYHHVWFSQNARGYTGLLLFTLLGSGAFLLLLAEPARHTRTRVAAYAVSMACAALIHVTAAIVVVAHALIWLALVIAAAHSGRLREIAWQAPLAAMLLAGVLSFAGYAPVLGQFVATILHPSGSGSAPAWKNPAWAVAEALRVLRAGVPGGLFTVVLVLGTIGVGLTSYWRRSRTATAVMVLPGLLTAGVVYALSHNLWPRFVFFSAGFAALIAIRGGFAVAAVLVPRHAVRVATAGALALVLLSLLTVPRAWGPKQDFGRARAFVAAHAATGDAIAAVDMTGYVYTRYFRLPWTDVASDSDLVHLERAHARTWLVLTFPGRLEKVHPDLFAHLMRNYRRAASFPGTLGGGTLIVLVKS